MRVTLWLLPVAAIIACTAPEIVKVVFGVSFTSAAPLLSLLVIGGVANVMLIVSLTNMMADGRPARTVFLTLPLIPLALNGHFLLIPRLGAKGVVVTMSVLLIGASAAVASTYGLWNVCPPVGTVILTLIIALVVGTGSVL